jgi:hypothetical protein
VVKTIVGIERKPLEVPIWREKNNANIVSGTRPQPAAARRGRAFVLHHVNLVFLCLAAYRQSARALAVHWPKPLATMLRMTAQT